MAILGLDAYSPKEIAAHVEEVGIAKANLQLLPMATLGLLAGGFIGLGALYFLVLVSDPALSFGTARLLGGLVFSLGLILVVVAGAELFTGNNLIVMAWASGRITSAQLLRNWGIVYCANFLGALGLAVLVWMSGHGELGGGVIAEKAVRVAASKAQMPIIEAFFQGVLCNILVCLAVWLAMGGRTVTDKILAVIPPISAFVAAGFEHCVANMYFFSLGLLLKPEVSAETGIGLSLGGTAENLFFVSLGNIVGGAGLVALVYWIIYRRHSLP